MTSTELKSYTDELYTILQEKHNWISHSEIVRTLKSKNVLLDTPGGRQLLSEAEQYFMSKGFADDKLQDGELYLKITKECIDKYK